MDSLPRGLYIATFILYLVALLFALWFILHYLEVPAWVWIFFFVGLLIPMIGLIIKETLIKYTYEDGVLVVDSDSAGWSIVFITFHIIAFSSITAGFVFVILYSAVPAWVWLLFGLSIIFSLIASIVVTVANVNQTAIWILAIVILILYVSALIAFIAQTDIPSWVWLIFVVALILGILANILESYTSPIVSKNIIIVKQQ